MALQIITAFLWLIINLNVDENFRFDKPNFRFIKKETDEKESDEKESNEKMVDGKKDYAKREYGVKEVHRKKVCRKRSSTKKKKEFGGFVCQDDTWICFMLLKLKFQIKTPSTICGFSNLNVYFDYGNAISLELSLQLIESAKQSPKFTVNTK